MQIPAISEETRRRTLRLGIILILAGSLFYALPVAREAYSVYLEAEKNKSATEKARAEEAAAKAKLEAAKTATASSPHPAPVNPRGPDAFTFYLRNVSPIAIDLWWRDDRGVERLWTAGNQTIPPGGTREQISYVIPGTWVIKDHLSGRTLRTFPPPTTQGDQMHPMFYP